jgi:sugar lactone lactonase YvrE
MASEDSPRHLLLAAMLLTAPALLTLVGCGSGPGTVVHVPPPSTRSLLVADSFNSRVVLFDSPFSTGEVASTVLGQDSFTISTQATTPSGLAFPAKSIADSDGNIWVADTFNNRVLEYKQPITNGMAASVVIGQPDFTSSNIAAPTQSNLIDPLGLAFDPAGDLWVVDGSRRVLEYAPPFTNGMSATLVIGQLDFTSDTQSTTASGLNYPAEIAFDAAGNLWLVDQGNNRVLEYSAPFTTGENAGVVIGQADFTSSTAATTAAGMDSPYGISFDGGGNLWVSDARNLRVLEYTLPFSSGQSASLVLGQSNFTSSGVSGNPQVDLNNPAGLAFDTSGNLFVSETGASCVVMFEPPFKGDMSASLIIGQQSFNGGFGSTSASGLAGPESVSTSSF